MVTAGDDPCRDLARDRPLHQQIADGIRQRIAAGELRGGARLPSSRDLARELGVSRATVELAYSNLAAEGYVARRSAAGTRVLPARTQAALPSSPPTALLFPGLATRPAEAPGLFQMGLPALDAFPRKVWSRLAARHARSLSASKMVYQEPSGYLPLRRAIANHLAIGRGLRCSEDQVFVTGGFLGGLALVVRALLAGGDQVLVEDPGFPPAREALALAGGVAIPVPVDGDGMDFGAGLRAAPDARAVLVAPSVQFPLGRRLAGPRWQAMLDWARRSDGWVLRDDYEENLGSEARTEDPFRATGAAERVLHLGSFSNVLFPGCRLGYVVAPLSVVPRLRYAAALLPTHQSLLDQMALSDFMTEGHLARHVVRMRTLYARRRMALARALEEVFGGSIGVEVHCGMHLLLRLPPHWDDASLAATARVHGLAVNALSPLGVATRTGRGLLLGYTNIVPEAAVPAALRLKSALAGALPR